MRIELEFRPDNSYLILTTDNDDPDRRVQLEVMGKEAVKKKFFDEVENGLYGHYGHIIDHLDTTNLDLQAAVRGLKNFKVKAIIPPVKAKKLPVSSIS